MTMDLSMYSKDNKKVLKETVVSKNIFESENEKKLSADNSEVLGGRAGRPAMEDPKARLSRKYTINLSSYEGEFIENLQKETGVPISTYLRKKLLEAKAFK